MLISVKWLKELIDFDVTTQELDNILTMLGIEVEHVVDYKAKYANFYTAHALDVQKHPDAKKLTVCKISLGDTEKTVICGAPNIATGQKIILGLEGAIVPKNQMRLENRAIRGVMSEGMICSQSELELGDDESGIWVLPPDTPVGVPLAEFAGMDDIILEVSLTPNRADCLSHLGIARDLAAYFNKPLNYPKIEVKSYPKNEKFSVEIEDSVNCPRYTARVINNVKVGESPDWLKNILNSVGFRPINNIVDVTNYAMILFGQPLHSFDADKLENNKIVVKSGVKGEKFQTLDGKTVELEDFNLLICDGKKPVAIGGVMGGANSEITSATTNVLLESAFFKPSSVRKTSKKLAIQSESSYRFERGVDIDNVDFVSEFAANLICEISGGTLDSELIDCYPEIHQKQIIKIRFDKTNKIIGLSLSGAEIIELLKRLHFKLTEQTDEYAMFEIPNYRMDITGEIDLVEEVARLYNYDNLTPQYQSIIDLNQPEIPKELRVSKRRELVRNYFTNIGFNEILTQNQTDPRAAQISNETLVKIANPLGEELSIMRNSMIPSTLKTVIHNIKLGSGNLQLFELGKTFHYSENFKNTYIENLFEQNELIVCLTGKKNPKQWSKKEENYDFYDIKGIAEQFCEYLNFNSVKFTKNEGNDPFFGVNSIVLNINKVKIAKLGEIKKEILKMYDIEQPVYVFLVDMSKLYDFEIFTPKYSPVTSFPVMRRDIAFILESTISAESVSKTIKQNGGELLKKVEIFDVYKGKNIGEGKVNIAFSLTFSSLERTLVESEIDNLMKKIIGDIENKFSASLRSF